MATASASASAAIVSSPAMFTSTATVAKSIRKPAANKVHYISGLNSFNGLKAHNSVASLGLPECTDQSFAKIVSSLNKGSRGGGSLSATCNAVAEIFKIAAIMNGLTLVGVAVGFVLLRVEAFVEESEE